ncbi:MAG: hypothetical protein ACO1RT_04610, partial [Planctomycetaceae bacterium]
MQRRDMLKTLAAGATTVGVTATANTVALANAVEATKPGARAGTPVEQHGAKFWTETSLNRVFPNSDPGSASPLTLKTARNAQLSFQVCFRNLKDCSMRVRAAVDRLVARDGGTRIGAGRVQAQFREAQSAGSEDETGDEQ